MKTPVDQHTLHTMAHLLGLNDGQAAAALADIETTLRHSYTFRPLAVRHHSYEQFTASLDADEFALLYLQAALNQTGQRDLADDIARRALVTGLPTWPTP
ncbi:hypothetical protein [Streptomyces fractus]|uniref:hypothetical protein n=1 Tax=Streptomyces fractus TaxID=641806 RepID=UPI003CEDCEB0